MTQEDTTPAGDEFHLRPPVTCVRTEHVFERISGIDVRCKRCKVGYQVGPNVQLVAGHLVISGKRVT